MDYMGPGAPSFFASPEPVELGHDVEELPLQAMIASRHRIP